MAEICSARAESHVADRARGRTASKQASDEGEQKQFGCVGDHEPGRFRQRRQNDDAWLPWLTKGDGGVVQGYVR